MDRAERNLENRLASQQEQDDWKWLMGDARGRRIAYRLIQAGSLDTSMFQGNSRDVYQEGRRAAAREVLARTKDSYDQYLVMLTENERKQHAT